MRSPGWRRAVTFGPPALAFLAASLLVFAGCVAAVAEPLSVAHPRSKFSREEGPAAAPEPSGGNPVPFWTLLLEFAPLAAPCVNRAERDTGTIVGYIPLPFHDPLGSTRLAATHDPAQSPPHPVTYEAAWQPFGVEVPLSGQGEEKYLGKQAPADDGLYRLGARQYDPETGRFQGLDPVHGVLAAPQTLNRYAYATNDPVGNADPNGMCEFVCLAIILVAIGLTLGVTATVVPEVGAVLDPVMLALGFIPFVGDFLSDPYFAARSVTECALGRCDAANLGSDLAFLFLPGGPLSNVAHGRRLLSATTGGLFGAGRMGNRADDLTYLARAGTRDNYRRMLVGFTGVDTGDAFQPHHVFPQKFERYPSPP